MTTARPPTTTNRTPDSSRYARSSSNIEAEDNSRPAPGGQAGLPVLHRCELGAGSGVGDEGGERSVQQPRDRDVVDLHPGAPVASSAPTRKRINTVWLA